MLSDKITWGRLVGIRLLRPGDAGAICRFMRNPEVAHLLFEEQQGIAPPALLLALHFWAQRMSGSPDWAIVNREKRVIGRVTLWRLSDWNRSAMLTIYIGEQHNWGRGFGTDALRLALRYAFGAMGLHRVELNVFEFNERAIRSYEKVGFTWEGVRRKALRRTSSYCDIITMGILREEFLLREVELKS